MTPREIPVGDFFGDVVPLWSEPVPEPHPLADVLADALSILEPHQVEMVMLHTGGFSVREIADLTGMSKSQVHRELPELMARVKELLQSNEEVTNYVHQDGDTGADPQGGDGAPEPS